MSNENINASISNDSEISSDYKINVAPKIHNIGQITLAIAIVAMFVPPIIMYFGFGWNAVSPLQYASAAALLLSVLAIGEFTDHLRYYPLMGAAPLYMSYLSGNVSGMRVPVATSCTTAYKQDILSPKGQILAVVGVATSVIANIVVLLIIIFFGQGILSVLPEVVISAFNFVPLVLVGYLIPMYLAPAGGGNAFKGILNGGWVYIITAIVCYFFFKVFLKQAMLYMLWSFLVACVVCYIVYKIKEKKTAGTSSEE